MEKYFEDTVQTIRKLIQIDSTKQPAKNKMPFGQGPADALNAFLQCAETMGFSVHNYDNYVGEVVFGSGEDFAILAHLDVVPAGNGWSHPPFGGDIADGKLFGRGAMDDKGPAVICLYALKALKDEGFIPNKTIKLIVGCNEESGWECIEHYNLCTKMPKYGFTPDADFPVIYAEKGILHVKFYFPVHDAPFTELYGGEGANMVCDAAYARTNFVDGCEDYNLQSENGLLISRGVSAHGSTPEKGINAFERLFAFFGQFNKDLQRVYDVLFNDCYHLKDFSDETGHLTFSPDIASFQNNTLEITVDIRYPATLPLATLLKALDRIGVPYEQIHHQPALYNDKNSFLIQTLQKVFNEATGQHCEPIAIGGGTYARALECGAGFGPQLMTEPVTIHQKDEYISLQHIGFLLKLYKRAIEELTK